MRKLLLGASNGRRDAASRRASPGPGRRDLVPAVSAGPGSVAETLQFRTFEACRNERSLWGSTAVLHPEPALPALLAGPLRRGAAPKGLAQEEVSAALVCRAIEHFRPARDQCVERHACPFARAR